MARFSSAGRHRWTTGRWSARRCAVDTHVWISAEDGFLWRIDMATGNIAATVEIGEPLASGPVMFGDRLLVAGRSGVLFNVRSQSVR